MIHVTQALAMAGMIRADFFTEHSRDLGSAVHLATELLDRNNLDEQSVSPEIAPRLESYRIFLAEVRPEIHAIEQTVDNSIYLYTGTPDRVVTIGGRRGILDLKPPSPAPWHRWQLAAYAGCFDGRMARWTLHLSNEGKRPKLIEHTDRHDWTAWLAILTVAKLRLEYGLAKGE